MTFDQLMHRSRQWDREHAELMRDHAEYRRRLGAALFPEILNEERRGVGNGSASQA